MGSFSIWHWLIVLLIVVLVFGTKKLKNIGSDLGGAVKGFKDGMKERRRAPEDAGAAGSQVTATQQPGRRQDHHRRRSQDQVLNTPWPGALRAPAGMPRMIDLGIDKIALIGAVALIVIGPEKLPRVARTVGTLLGKAQRYVADVKAEVNRSIELEELKKMKDTVEDAARDVERLDPDRRQRVRERVVARRPGLTAHGRAGRCRRRCPSTSTRRRTGASSAAPRRSGTRRATASAPRRCPGAAAWRAIRPQAQVS